MVWNDSNYKIVSGLFSSETNVQALLIDLQRQGIGPELVNILMSNQTRDHYADLEKDTKIPEGASIGGLSGGTLGAVIGGLTMAGSLLVPGLNLLVAGPIVGVIAGGAVGTAAGGLVGALVGAGMPEYEAKSYEKQLEQDGNVVVLVHALKDETHSVKDLFKRHGAHDVTVKNEKQQVSTGLY